MKAHTDNLRLRQIQEHRTEVTTYRVPAEWIPAVWGGTVSTDFLVYLGIITPVVTHQSFAQSEAIRKDGERQFMDTVTVA